MGLFGKKQQPVAEQSSPELPEVPAVEELDLPPPPQYPRQRVEPRPQIVMPPQEAMQTQEVPKIEVPVEQLLYPKGPMPRPDDGLTRERALQAIGATDPIFVKVDDYREILDGMTRIRNNLKEATDLVLRLNELKNEEDKEFEKWRVELEDVQRKLMYVDKIIFES